MKPWQYWSLSGLVIAVAALYVGGWYLSGRSLPRDTTIANVDVSSMTPAAAAKVLAEGIETRAAAPIVVQHKETKTEFLPTSFNFEVDIAQSVAQAGGERSWYPKAMWRIVAGGGDFPPVFTADNAELRTAITEMSADVDVPVLEPSITFPKGQPEVQAARVGEVVDQTEAFNRVKAAYLMTTKPVTLPIERIRPTVTSQDAQAALEAIAKPAVSGPVTLVIAGKAVELPVSVWAPALSVEPVDGTMTAKLDPAKLTKPLLAATKTGDNQPVNASFKFESGKPVIVPSKQGAGIDPIALSSSLIPVLAKQGAERKLAVQTTLIDPAFTTADAEKLGIKERVSSFKTNYPHAEYRNINQSEAARRINGYVLKPGETFSFNTVVGERTAANGFAKGFMINSGVFTMDYGGGVSQVATTTYNAAFFAGLDDVEHHPHSLYISRYPVGREATVAYGKLDLRFKNPYDTGIVIRAWVDKSAPGRQGTMHVEMYGTKVYEITAGQSAKRNFRTPGTRTVTGKGCSAQAPSAGFDIDIYRTFKQGGKVVRKETVTARYAAGDRIVCG